MLVALALGLALLDSPTSSEDTPVEITPAPLPNRGFVAGVVTNSRSGQPMAGVLVLLSCSCLSVGPLEVLTDERGSYSFEWLPEGAYTITVILDGRRLVSKLTGLPLAGKFRANFPIDPMLVARVPCPVVSSKRDARAQRRADRRRVRRRAGD